jgi:flavin-dependent dehydrogenase
MIRTLNRKVTMHTIHEPARDTPIAHTCDLCVIGGSCTGLFAAVRAAQLGATVALVENNGTWGGVATAGLVNVWHSIYDTAGQRQIIGGLTVETIERLVRRDAATLYETSNASRYAVFNSAELILVLDDLIREHSPIRPFLHTRFVQPVAEDGRMSAAIVEDKTGRRAIQARAFIDATGDGDVIARLGLPTTRLDDLQPPTTCALIYGLDEVARRNPGFVWRVWCMILATRMPSGRTSSGIVRPWAYPGRGWSPGRASTERTAAMPTS